MLNFKEILELIDKVAEKQISAVEIERAGFKVRVEGKPEPSISVHGWSGDRAPMPSPVHTIETSRPVESRQHELSPPPAPPSDGIDPSWHIVTSPIVGTFYRSPNPESAAFSSEGDRITKGSVLCIVEAMKLMNEIESDVEGVIMKIFPQNGQPIEYGEKLFAVKL